MYELRNKTDKGNSKGLWKKVRISALALILFFICSGMLYVTKLASAIQDLPDGDIKEMTNRYLNEETEQTMADYWTIAIFGVDSREGNIGRGTNADSLMLLTIDKENGEIRLASVYRDTLLMSNIKNGSCYKINSSYFEGGPEGAVMALNENLDLKITDYVTFSWKAAADAVNLLGGININITDAEFAYLNSFITETAEQSGVDSVPLMKSGLSHLDGVQTVAYCRLRLMDDDIHRTKRQQLVMEKVLEKIREADLSTINLLLETVLPQVATSIDGKDFFIMSKGAGNYHIVGTTGFPDVYETAKLGKRGECLIPNTLENNVVTLHEFLYQDSGYQCSERVTEIGKEILKQAIGK